MMYDNDGSSGKDHLASPGSPIGLTPAWLFAFGTAGILALSLLSITGG